jgi:DNA helicase HerA-like ATPase
MYANEKLWIAKAEEPIYLLPKMANRHGLISGATGTGKTITLKVMAESFSDLGVPVFLADIKGDLAGMCLPGIDSEGMQKRIQKFGLAEANFTYKDYPTRFWDVFGKNGHPVRTTVSEMGPLLLARLLGLNDTQSGVLNIVFRVADDRGLLLLDLKDLKAMLSYMANNAKSFTIDYGNITSASVGAIQRAILSLEDQGGEQFFGEPALEITDWMRTGHDGRGYINILHCVDLFHSPALYSTFLLWLLSELFETLPEMGDLKKPRMVFFFDEAHLLFNEAPKILLQKIEQLVRLIRSKGVGVYFITQSPKDIPDTILSQLGNRVQHALRAYSPAEQKVVRAAAETFRPNPAFDTMEAITQLATGEALVSFLAEDGSPSVVERAFILPPQSRMGIIDDGTRREVLALSDIGPKYDVLIDRESAYEYLTMKTKREQAEKEEEEARIRQIREDKERAKEERELRALEEKERIRQQKEFERAEKERIKQEQAVRKTFYGTTTKSKYKTPIEHLADTAMNTVGREVGRQFIRGILGMLTKK